MEGLPAVAESSTGGALVRGLPALGEGSTEGGLLGDPPAFEEGSTEGSLVGGPPALAGGSTNGGSCDRRVGVQVAVPQVRVDGRNARRLAAPDPGGLVRVAFRRPPAADCPVSPMEGSRSQGGVVGAAA